MTMKTLFKVVGVASAIVSVMAAIAAVAALSLTVLTVPQLVLFIAAGFYGLWFYAAFLR